MAWIANDFVCDECGTEFEELHKHGEEVYCPACGALQTGPQLAAPKLATFSMASPADKAVMLKKRSAKHTAKEVAKNPEKWGRAGIERQQSQKAPSVGYTGKSKK